MVHNICSPNFHQSGYCTFSNKNIPQWLFTVEQKIIDAMILVIHKQHFEGTACTILLKNVKIYENNKANQLRKFFQIRVNIQCFEWFSSLVVHIALIEYSHMSFIRTYTCPCSLHSTLQFMALSTFAPLIEECVFPFYSICAFVGCACKYFNSIFTMLTPEWHIKGRLAIEALYSVILLWNTL